MSDPVWTPSAAERFAALAIRVAVVPFALAIGILVSAKRHWFLFLLFAFLGTLFGLAKVISEPPIYEARAVLRLDTTEQPLEEQISLLQSETVFAKAIQRLGYDKVVMQEVDPRNRETLAEIPRFYLDAEEFLEGIWRTWIVRYDSGFMDLDHDRRIQQARDAFRRTTSVASEGFPGGDAALVRLQIFGTMMDGLRHQLSAWIESFRQRIDEIEEDTWGKLLAERIMFWTDQEQKALAKLRDVQVRVANGGDVLSLAACEDEHRRAADFLRKFRDLQVEKMEKAEMRKTVGIQVVDPPSVSVKPSNPSWLPRVAFSACVGSGIGAALGLLVEALRLRRRKRKALREREAAARAAAAPASPPDHASFRPAMS